MADTIRATPPRSVAAITAFRDAARVRDALRAHFGAEPPQTPGWIETNGARLSCLAPDRFLAQAPSDATLPATLAPLLEGIAAVTDQSDLWHTLTITGPQASDRLARIVPVDLHPSVFPAGALALTRGFHVDIRLWRLGSEEWELAVSRSHAATIAHALDEEGQGSALDPPRDSRPLDP